jgi:hypothetical protein
VEDYDSLFMLLSFVLGGQEIQSAQELHWIMFPGDG